MQEENNKVGWLVNGTIITIEEYQRKCNLPIVTPDKQYDEYILQLKSNEFKFYNQRTKKEHKDSSTVKIYKYFFNNEWMYFKGNTVPSNQNKIDRDTYFEILFE